MNKLAKNYQRKSQANEGRKSMSFSADVADRMRFDEAIILSFLQQKDVPAWFRGTSTFQINAADALLNALRDDTEQRTSHRVRGVLISIGLSPMVTSKQIQFLMRLSRGNDLAFLWFLMELHYKTPNPTTYSVNEQLIMSSIAHLDMITTFRELDKVLPPGHAPLKEIQRMEKKLLTEEKKKIKAHKPHKPKPILPYFEPLVRPKPYGKPLTIPIPDYRVTFENYEHYKNPNYVVHNELNRWYAGYELQQNKRVVNRILNEQIMGIFEDYAKVSLKAETVFTLCEKHKAIKELEERMEHELRVVARDRCLKLMDLNGKHKEETRRRILEQLEKDIQRYVCQFKELSECSRRESLSQALLTECCCEEGDLECECDDEFSNIEENSSADKSKEGTQNKNKKLTQNEIKTNIYQNLGMGDVANAKGSEMPKSGNKGLNSGGDNQFNQNQSERKNSTGERHSNASTGSKRRSRMSDFSNKYCAAYDYGHYLTASPTPSQVFFEAPKNNVPYKFDYRKIFRYKYNTEENLNIKRAFVEALDHDLELLNKLYEDRTKPTVAELTGKCAVSMWKEGVKKKTEELEAEEAKGNKKTPNESVMPKSPLDKYTQKYYDPEDKPLMHGMLKDALEFIAQNPKFVLASMPDAHKLPIMKEWIYVRYGKVYTRTDRYKSFRLSLKIFRALDKVTLNVPTPNTKELGSNLFVDYSCRDYLIKKANFIKRKYYDQLDAAIMEQARVFWFAMRPYLCSSGPPRNTYFAYMPSRVLDITRFRLWKPTEFMNAKKEWEKRQLAKKRLMSF